MGKATIMLAKVATPKLIKDDKMYSITEKLDGQPAVVHKDDTGTMSAMSRKGTPITSIQHILDELQPIMATGQEIVGELYIDGLGSAEISGKVRKDAPCPELKLYLFTPFWEYKLFGEHTKQLHSHLILGSYLKGLLFGNEAGTLNLLGLENHYYDSFYPHIHALDSPLMEGLIAMEHKTPWVPNKRSNGYLKLIQEPTMDMRVVDIVEAVSKEGEPLGRVGAFMVEWQDGTCKVGAGKLSHKEAEDIFDNHKSFTGNGNLMLGTIIEVKYKRDAKYTSPRQPTFQRFRLDKDEFETSFPE